MKETSLRRLSLFVCCSLLLFASPLLLRGAEKNWMIGYAQRDLTPADLTTKTYYMAGYGSNNPVKGIYDPVWVRCISLDPGTGEKIVLASLDVVGVPYSRVLAIREKLADWSKKNNARIEIFATHSHASIDTMGMWGPPGKSGCDETWLSFLEKSVVDAAQEALAAAKPGTLFFGQIMAPGMVVDPSPPQVPNEEISMFRFEPNDKNVKPIWLMHFSCHPEALESTNNHLSSDFVHATREIIEKTKNTHAMYINGAVGSMQTTPKFLNEKGERITSQELVDGHGKKLGEIALKIDNWKEVEPELLIRSKTATIPIYNNNFILAQKAGIFGAKIPGGEHECDPVLLAIARKSPEERHLPTMLIEVSYMRIGKDIGIAYVPGELAPELANGQYLPKDRCNNPELTTEKPLFSILPEKTKLIFGLANDEIGYILPVNDYYISPETPWVSATDKFGYRHYPETNGTGPETAGIIAKTLEELVK